MTTPLLLSVPPCLTACLLAGLAMVGWHQRERHSLTGLFPILCLFGSLLNLDLLVQLNATSAKAALHFTRRLYLFHPFLVPLLIHFMHAYLGVRHRNWLVALACGGATLIAALSQSGWIIARMAPFSFGYAAQGGLLFPFMAVGAISATLYNAWLLTAAIDKEERSVFKNKLRYMRAGLLSFGVLTCLNLPGRFGCPVYPLGSFGFIPLSIFAAGVLKYDLLDLRALLRRGLAIIALALVPTMLCTAALVTLRSGAGQHLPWVSFWLFFLIVFSAAIGFGPVEFTTLSLIDRFLAGQSYDYRITIKQASREIASALDYAQISRLLYQTLIGAMGVEHAALFIANTCGTKYTAIAAVGEANPIARNDVMPADQVLIKWLTAHGGTLIRSRLLEKIEVSQQKDALEMMIILSVEVVLPMIYRDRLNGFLVLGEKISKEMYLSADIDLLETLGHQSALAIENARTYEALRVLNRSLEDRVATRTHELKQALEEKERVQDLLVRSESLAAIGQLVAGVAHELNNPLASVTSLLQSTIEDLEHFPTGGCLDDDMIDDLRFADKELARAKSIVSSLLGLSRQTQVYTEAVDLNDLVSDALRMLHNCYKRQPIDIRQHLANDPVIVQGNFANLGQALVNVIANAIQAVSGRAGEIILRTGREKHAQAVWFSCADNGPGIDQSIRNDVFKPFFTTKAVGHGTGLGLYICHEIIQKHDGCITVHTSTSGGALVCIRLPTAEVGPF